MKIIAITQARTGSTRLPGKVLKVIEGKTLLQIHLERLSKSQYINSVIVATTWEDKDINIVNVAKSLHLRYYRGSTNDVLDRFYQAAKIEMPDLIVRITADCPLIDPVIVDEIIAITLEQQLDYASNSVVRNYPDGVDAEVFTFNALEKAWREATLSSDREHVTPYIWRNSSLKGGSLFSSGSLSYPHNYSQMRLTVDEPSDLEVITQLISALGTEHPWRVYADFLIEHPEVRSINGGILNNEGYYLSLKKDQIDHT